MYFMGDLHGSFSHLLYTLTRLGKRGINIMQVGDFGIGFHGEQDYRNLDLINQALIEWDAKLYVIRGNHDDPKFFKGELRDKINNLYSNIYFIEDYEVVEIEGLKLFCLGGGVSIDRTYRTKNKSYWEDEVVIYEPGHMKHTLLVHKHIDIFVSHSAPMWCHPKGVDAPIVREYCMIDENLKQDLIDERETIGEIFDQLNEKFKFKHHFYGHFHANYRRKVADTTHILLGIGDLLDYDKLIELEKSEDNKKNENNEHSEIKD